jgi:hypothetical protein
MWMASRDHGLAAVAWGPCVVEHVVSGVRVRIEVTTEYPFDDTVSLRFTSATPVRLPLRLRIPAWCHDPGLTIDGRATQAALDEGWLLVDRVWTDGETAQLRLPMRAEGHRRPSGGMGVSLGPLVLAFSPGEIWERLPGSLGFGDWEVRPRRSWNMMLAVDPGEVDRSSRVERLGVASPPFGLRTGSPPFGLEGVPLKVWLPGRRLPEWREVAGSAEPPPSGPFPSGDFDHPVPLVPYGSTRIRIAEFPVAAPSTLGARGMDEAPV